MKKATKQTASTPARKSGKTEMLKQMEASKVPPAKVGAPATNAVRVCWAAKTLVTEFTDLFPETPVEYSAPDGRNTMLDVTFDITAVDDVDRDAAIALIELVQTDARVAYVITGDGQAPAVLVSFKSNARTQDLRDSFGLADAWDVLTDGEDYDPGYGPEDEDIRRMSELGYSPEPNLVLDFTEEGSL